MKYRILLGMGLAMLVCWTPAQARKQSEDLVDKFRQLGPALRDPNVYRNAAGAPGHEYWQQTVDYRIDARLDESARTISAVANISYSNRSPDPLPYLWLQLEQNRFRRDSLEQRSITGSQAADGKNDQLSFSALRRHQAMQDHAYGFQLQAVEDGRGNALPYTVVDTMMRIDLPKPLRPEASVNLRIAWQFTIVEEAAMNSRGGFEHFSDSDTDIFFLAQWFPRLAAYTDYTGWQHKQFLGRGEFTLEFGDYEVALTVPADHIVSATGVLQNPKEVLSAAQRERLAAARTSDRPVYIVTPAEALQNEQQRREGMRTWRFKADNVRDFAWASSRKFIWDAAVHRQPGGAVPEVLAMSFFPNEADPIWSQYSTEAVLHTLDVYSRFSFPYPYPTAQSVNTWDRGGMEYPMITFNGYRPKPIDDKTRETLVADAPASTYSRAVKHGLIGVIIHEIGHIYFPMVVNSDERRWTWMDEGINSFLQYIAELEWEENFHIARERPSILDAIGGYMVSEHQVPIMTQSDSVLQFGPNAYTKPAAALVVLRETVMGRELFDHAFKEYARRWQFKRPTPTDFFRTMEDASAVDLDWFWRGWFFSTDHVDVGIAEVREYQVASRDPQVESEARRRLEAARYPEPLAQRKNREAGSVPRIERVEGLRDFYNERDQFTVSPQQQNDYQNYLDGLETWERQVLERAVAAAEFVYFVEFENVGGLLTPLPVLLQFADGSTQRYDIPAEIWRRNSKQVTKMFILPKRLAAIELDPDQQTADVARSNNYYPRRILPSRLELFKYENKTRDLMREMLVELKGEEKTAAPAPAVPLRAGAQGD